MSRTRKTTPMNSSPSPSRRSSRVLLVLLALAVPAGVVLAQDGDGEGSYASIEVARSTGRGIVVGQGRAAFIPDVYTVRRGDTLWGVTGRYYGNPYEWPRVWSYNPEITNPHWIYPHDRIRLRGEGEIEQLPTTSVRAPARAAVGTVWLRDQGYLDAEALEDAGVIIGSPEEHMLLSQFDEVYLRFEEGAQIQPGREYTIFRRIEEEEREPDESGELVRIYGTVRLRSYDRDRGVGRATITEALDPIERGFHVAPIPRRFEVVPPRENATDVQADVVATLRPLRLSADSQIVFVNAGQEQGVRLGNRFFVIRSGDEWQSSLLDEDLDYGQELPDAETADEDQYPPEVTAEGRVVSVRPSTSTLLITRSLRAVEVGDRAEMRRGF